MRRDVAEKVHMTMVECSAKLNESVRLVMDNCPAEEFKAYRQTVGKIMGWMFLDVMEPIHREHPDLEPEELRRPDAPAPDGACGCGKT